MAPKAAAKADAAADAKKKAAAKKKKEEKKTEEEAPRMNAPDRDEFEKSLESTNKEIEKLQGKLKKLSGEIGERSTGKDEFFHKRGDIRKRLDDASALINDLQGQKDSIMSQLGQKREEGKAMRGELNKMKKDVGFTSEDQIVQRIAEIEFTMATTVMVLKEEKKLLLEITELKRRRPKLDKMRNLEENVAAHQSQDSGLPLKERLDEIKEKLNIHRDAKKLISEEYKALMDERNNSQDGVSELFAARDEINKEIGEKIKERNEKRNAFRATEQEYKEFQNEERKKRQEKYREENEKWKAEQDQQRRVRKAEKMEETPHIHETVLIEQTIAWCKSQLPKEENKKDDAKKEIDHSNKDGEMVLLSKDKRDEEFYYAPTKKGKAIKQKKKDSGKTIKHNAETFRLFDQLKLQAPLTTDDIEPMIGELQKQADMYAQKVKDWERDRDDLKKKILAGDDEEETEKPEKTEKAEKADE